MPQLLQQLSEHEKVSYNAIVHRFAESSTTLPSTRITNDTKLLSEAIYSLSIFLPPNSKLLMVGWINDKNSLLLKVKLTSKNFARQFVIDFN